MTIKHRLIYVAMLGPGIISAAVVFVLLEGSRLAPRIAFGVGIIVTVVLGAAVAVVLGLVDAAKARQQDSNGT